MILFDKIRLKFQNLLGFEKLNPLENFDFDESGDDDIFNDNIELFKRAIENHPELKEVIWIAIYHCLNTFESDNEYLTVLNNDYEIIADLIEGDENGVDIPDDVKEKILDGKVLSTFHNHFNGAILPSSKDLKNTILPFVRFMVITSNGNIGIILNDNDELDETFKKLLKQEWMFYLAYLSWSFNNEMSIEIQEIYDLNISKDEKQKTEQVLFEKFISKNISRFCDEFNSRMKKYNVYFLHINIKER